MTNDRTPFFPGARADAGALREIRHSKFVIPLFAWVSAGFLFLVLAWAALFFVARLTRVESVPLAQKGGAS